MGYFVRGVAQWYRRGLGGCADFVFRLECVGMPRPNILLTKGTPTVETSYLKSV